MKYFYPLFIFLFVLAGKASGQKEKPVQLSGVVLTADSLPQFVPFAHVVVKNQQRGTMTGKDGFFSFVALPSDTILFSVIGFKKEKLVVPDTLSEKEYLVRVVMERDTTLLEEVTLYPWPTPDQFDGAFMALQLPTKDEDIAMRNLAIQELKARAAAMGFSAAELQDFVIQQQNSSIYNFGRYQGFSNGGTAILGALSNPFAWNEFFKAIKRGDFSSKK